VHLSQTIVDLMMVLVHALELAVICQHMIQSQVREVGFRLGVPFQQPFYDAGHRPHLRRRREAGQNTLNLVKYAQEYGVFRD
jgi:hypothetical protein